MAAETSVATAAGSGADDKKLGTRVFKKTSQNGKITTYLGKRDFLDRGESIDLIDGMVLIDRDYVTSETKVTVQLLAAFRYGREDLDVLGLTFRKDLISQCFQVFPPLEGEAAPGPARPLTRLQERLRKKLGDNAYPFWFEIPPNSASSVTLQPAQGDTGKPCGVDYEIRTMVGGESGAGDKLKKHSVRLAIRKLTYSPKIERPQPMVEAMKDFIISPGGLHLEASLDREMYYHSETISVNVHIQNNSNKTVKKIKVSVVQVADICIFTTASYSCDVDKIESYEGFPVGPGSTLSKVYTLCPLLQKNKEKRGLALDGQLKHEDTNLASSTTDILLPIRKKSTPIVIDSLTVVADQKLPTGSSDGVVPPSEKGEHWWTRLLTLNRSRPTATVTVPRRDMVIGGQPIPTASGTAAFNGWAPSSLPTATRALDVRRRTSHSSISLKRPTRYASLTQSMRENLGIIVQYKVKIRLFIAGALGGELAAELPFTLTHAKPAGEATPPPVTASQPGSINYATMRGATSSANGSRNGAPPQQPPPQPQPEEDVDLINFDSCEDDLVFEDFARIRVRGTDSADEGRHTAAI